MAKKCQINGQMQKMSNYVGSIAKKCQIRLGKMQKMSTNVKCKECQSKMGQKVRSYKYDKILV